MKNGWTFCLWHCRRSMETGLPDALDFSVKAKMVLVEMCKHRDTCSLGGTRIFCIPRELSQGEGSIETAGTEVTSSSGT